MSKVTLRSVYKVKEYHFQPCKQANGMNFDFVKRVRYNSDGSSEMILSEAERNDPMSDYFIPEDADITVTDGTTYDLDNPMENNIWLAIKDSDLIAPTRDARDADGNLIIDGDKRRYGRAELWVDIPGEESEKSVSKKKLITRAWTFIENDSVDGRLTKCKLLGKIMRNAPSADVEDYLYQRAEKSPNEIIDLYTNGDVMLKLLLIDAKDKHIITKNKGVYMYGEIALGATDEAVIYYFKVPTNKRVVDMLKNEVYPDFARKIIEQETLKPLEEEPVEKPAKTTSKSKK